MSVRDVDFFLAVVQPLHLLFLSLSRTHYFLDDLRIVILHLRIVFP
jgi:hypothetical protein